MDKSETKNEKEKKNKSEAPKIVKGSHHKPSHTMTMMMMIHTSRV